MALPDIPSITFIANRIIADVEVKINESVPSLPLSFVKVIARALAPFIFLLYQSILWVYKQIFPVSADFENLVKLGSIIGVEPVEAVFAVITCDVPGTGAQVDQGELWIGTNGITYSVTVATLIVAGIASDVPMQALTSGDIGNLINGEILDIKQTNLNLTGTATVTGTTTDGADQESDDNFSARVSLGYRTRKIAGTPGGYAFFGLETPNFTWVGPYANLTLPGTVDVYGKVNNQTDGIPTAAQLLILEDFLEFVDGDDSNKSHRRAINDILNVLPISARTFDVEVFINSGSSEINADVETAIKTYIGSLEPFIIGVSDSRKNVLTNTETSSQGNAVAVSQGAFITFVTITDTVTGIVETNYTFLGGEFGKFGNVTFTPVV